MSKLTIHIDEEALRRARIVAARRGMSVSRFVGAVLEESLGQCDEYERAMHDFFTRAPCLRLRERDEARRWPMRNDTHKRSQIPRSPK
jgi:hypothetical protein